MSLRSLALAAALALAGCAALPTLTERPEEYHLYRATRVAPTLEQRLSAADRYLREMPSGVHAKQVRSWFEEAEPKYYLAAFNRLPSLRAYEQALPLGPHIENVKSRIAALENRRLKRSRELSAQDARIEATQAGLALADAQRRAFVDTFKAWTRRLLAIQSFGEPTSELNDETIFAFRLTEPHGACQGDHCRKLLQLSYPVPGQRELVERAAVLEVQLELDRGLLARARLAGPALWTRLAEALSLKPLSNPTPDERAAAVSQVALLVSALLEPQLPLAECEVKPAPPIVLERKCRGRHVRLLAAEQPTDDDWLEIAPSAP